MRDLPQPGPVSLREDDDSSSESSGAGRDLEEIADSLEDPVDDPDRAILCAECEHEITHPDHRTRRDGGFEHSFANPAGIVFRIGCFDEASGCGAIGEPSSEFSWFSGYTWRVTLCLNCHTHLGWLFESADNTFYALILPRLNQ